MPDFKGEFALALERAKLCFEIRRIKSYEGTSGSLPAPQLLILSKLTNDLKKFDETYFDTKITNHIQRQNLWKLGIDGKDHDFPRLAYDTGQNASKTSEPGYIDAMETGLALMFRTIHEKLTPDFIRQLRFICCYRVLSKESGLMTEVEYEKSTRSHMSRFSVFHELLTQAGVEELSRYPFLEITVVTCVQDKDCFRTLTPTNATECWKDITKDKNSQCLNHKRYTAAEMENTLTRIIDQYYQTIQAAKNNDQRLSAISVFSKQLECVHAFNDGNLRTVIVLINKLLIENNLPLTCMNDPNIIDGRSTEEIAREIKQGMIRYLNIRYPDPKDRPQIEEIFSKNDNENITGAKPTTAGLKNHPSG